MSPATATTTREARRNGLKLDPVLVLIVLSILLLGLVMVTSASITKASMENGDPFMYARSQLFTAGAGILCALLLWLVPTELYEKYSSVLLGIALLLAIAVLIPGIGHEAKGGRRWIQLAGFNLQASEVVRVLVLCWIAAYSVRRAEELRTTFGGLALPLGVTFAICALLLLEPDFGAAAVLFATAFGLLFLAGARLRWVILCVVGAGAGFAALLVAAPYRLKRLTCFMDIWEHVDTCGYQVAQSQIAIGRGQWFGVGLGESVQKLMYLPEAHNDFLFAVLAEELGLMGVLLTLVLFLLLVWRVLHIARLASNAGLQFQAALAAAFGLWVGIQSLINIGVNMGALPTKGLTLPLMSYGRSSLLVTLAWLGLVLRVYHEAMARTRGSASAAPRRSQLAEGAA
jgi:cell division protein FtsW